MRYETPSLMVNTCTKNTQLYCHSMLCHYSILQNAMNNIICNLFKFLVTLSPVNRGNKSQCPQLYVPNTLSTHTKSQTREFHIWQSYIICKVCLTKAWCLSGIIKTFNMFLTSRQVMGPYEPPVCSRCIPK
jgi:hypothetical protein